MQQKLDLQLRGLYTSPNNLSGIPQGALEVANNVCINSKSLIELRRGQTQYGSALTIGAGTVNKMFNYSSSLIVSYDDKLAYDAGLGVFTDYTGTYEAPDADYKMRSLEALRNFYFTTSAGIYKLDSLTATPRPAGAPKALGGTGATTGASGFMDNNTAVAYRLVWGYVDANNNLVLGAPSQRLIVANTSGGTRDTSLNFLIPDGITTEFFYQLYRSLGSATATDEPSDELQLVAQGNPTSAEITAKSFTVTDQTPYSLMRATLYTSPSQEGIVNANNQPPLAFDMDVYKTCAFYANIKQKQSLSLALIAVDNPSLGFVTDATTDTTNGSPNLTAIADTSLLRVGMRCVGTGIPANTTIAAILGANSVQMSANATATATVSVEFQDRLTVGGVNYWAGSSQITANNQFYADNSGTPGDNVEATAENICDLINKSASNTLIYAYYISGVEDLPGQILFEERSIGGAAFTANSTAGTSFSPTLPVDDSNPDTEVESDNEVKQNRVIISKPGQIEAVPTYRFFDIGSANFPIKRVVALRDGIFFFKDDGIFRMSGETFENFTLSLVDNTITLKAPESAVPFNNQVFCMTTQGICAVTDSGVRIMSVPIENTLLELSSEQYENFAGVSFGVAYESARQYAFFTITQTTDTFATQAFVYNSLTDSWTRWVMDRTCGIVNPSVNKLFMAKPDGQVMIERKSFTNSDFADEQYAVTINSVDATALTITLASASDAVEGMSIKQGNRVAVISEINGNVLTVDTVRGFAAGAATLYTPIDAQVQWSPIDCENPGILKQFSEISLFFKNAAFTEIDASFSSNISIDRKTVSIENNFFASGWGLFAWGEQRWGGELGGQIPIRTLVPRDKQRAHWLILSIEISEAFTGFSLQGVSLMFNVMSSRFK